MDHWSAVDTGALKPKNNDEIQPNTLSSTCSTSINTQSQLLHKETSSQKQTLNEIESMEVDPSPNPHTGSKDKEECPNEVNVDGGNGSADITSFLSDPASTQLNQQAPLSTAGFSDTSHITMVEFPESSNQVNMEESPMSLTYPAYVKSLQDAEEVLHRFESNTKTRFCVWRCPKDFGSCQVDLKGKRLYWHEFVIENRITVKSNGIPFVMMGRKVFDCHHGRDRNTALKQKAMLKRQEKAVKKRNILTPSRKLDCPARVVFCEIIYFPDYKLETDTKHYRNVIAKTIRQHFTEGLMKLENIDRRIYLCFPSENEHKGHPIGQLDTKRSQRVDTKISAKIIQLVSTGVTSEREMKLHLDNYIARELFPGRGKPFHSNRRYYPNRSVIRLKMYNAYILQGLSLIDLENIEEALSLWTSNFPTDKFHLRRYTDVDESLFNGTKAIRCSDENDDEVKIREKVAKEQFLFVHQTAFQKHLLKRYGNDVVFLDPVCRTIKYAVPVFFLSVKTNCDYQVVASFVVQNECRESMVEALAFLKSWNPEWKPKIFMVDNDADYIGAVGESFPGCEVLLSDFHREQAWDRWLSYSSNDVTAHKNAILIYLGKLAEATSSEEFKSALELLQNSDVWKCNYGKTFRSWFENKWLTVKKRWVWFHKVNILSSVLTANNTVEWQNKEFTHQPLTDLEYTPLSSLLKILIDTIFPGKRNAYLEENGSAATKYPNLPPFFQRRPRQVVEHVAECITAAYDITSDDIVVDSSARGEFLVKSSDTDLEYNVHFGDNESFPHCDCQDWLKIMLPCKHIVAIMTNYKEWNWSKFPHSYKLSPYLTLDEDAKSYLNESASTITEVGPKANDSMPNSIEVNQNLAVGNRSTTDVNSSVKDSDTLQDDCSVELDKNLVSELLMRKQNQKSTALRCRELLSEINNISYVVHNRDGISSLLTTLQETLTNLKLYAVEDDLAVSHTTEADGKSIKSEGRESRLNAAQKRGKRTSEPLTQRMPTKTAKLNSDRSDANMALGGNGVADNQVFGEMSHVELLNIDFSLSTTAHNGTVVSPGGTQGQNTRINCPVFNTGETSEADSAVYKVLEFTQVNEKKDEEPITTYSSCLDSLPKYEESLISRNEPVTEVSINLAQSLLHEAFPAVKGFQKVARGAVQAFESVSGDFIQILHDGDLHWVCTSNVALGVSRDPAAVFLYDGVNQGFIANFTKQQLASFLCSQCPEMKVVMESVQQSNAVDCGVFAIAFATALAFGQDPSKRRFDVAKMRPHLVECLKSKKMSPFPEQSVVSGDTIVSKRKYFIVELFCSCRMPYEKPKNDGDLMAQCGNCKEWFHQRCEKIALEIFKASGLSFICSCCLKKGAA